MLPHSSEVYEVPRFIQDVSCAGAQENTALHMMIQHGDWAWSTVPRVRDRHTDMEIISELPSRYRRYRTLVTVL